MADQKIKCSVDNCTFWDNNVCKASSIEVAKNLGGGNDMEAGMMGGSGSDTSSQTKCVTFKPEK